MLRSLLFAGGIFLLFLGVQTLVVDKWITTYNTPAAAAESSYYNPANPFRTTGYSSYRQSINNRANGRNGSRVRRVYNTREWMPWSLFAAGMIIVLYTYSTSGRSTESDS